MARFSNFSMWRGRLPHWRADDERYYVTFNHKRPLEDKERRILFAHLLRAQRSRLDYMVLVVLPEKSEMIFNVKKNTDGEEYELSDVVEKAKIKAGRQIIKDSGERWAPFSHESYDRIMRDEAEIEEFANRIVQSPEHEGLAEISEEYDCLFWEQALRE